MARAVYVLGAAIFAQGMAEVMLAGFLPAAADGLGVSVPQAGLLVSLFALGMLVGAPLLGLATLRLPRRGTMVVILLGFAATQVVSALTTSFGLLLTMRFVGAFAYAGFWAVSAATVVALVPAGQRGRAMGVVAGGLTLATVVGLPLGTVLSDTWGWHAPFWVVAALSAVVALVVAKVVPCGVRSEAVSARRELRGLRVPRLWLSYAITTTSIAAVLVTFTYVSALLLNVTRLGGGWLPLVLLGFGVGSLAGVMLGGRWADRYPRGVLIVGAIGLAAASAGVALAAPYPMVAVVLVLLGFFGYVVNPALNSRVFAIAPDAPTLTGALNVSAFNVGISVGPWVGGRLIDADAGYAAIGWAGAVFALLALLAILLDRRFAVAARTEGAAVIPNSAATSATANGCTG